MLNQALSSKEYSDICKIIYPLLLNINDVPIENSCIAVNLLAKNIIDNNLPDIKTEFVCGKVSYKIGTNIILSFDYDSYNIEDDELGNFHAFLLMTKDNEVFFVDFMAPLFNEVISHDIEIPRKIFQKNINDKCEKDELENAEIGSYYFEKDEELTNKLIKNQDQNLINSCNDILNKWYKNKKPSIKIIQDQNIININQIADDFLDSW